MKKIILFFAVSILLVVGVWKGYQTPTSVLGEQAIPRITLTLVEEDTIATYSNVLAATVFDALQTVTTEKHIPLKTKKYDFGIFVEEIGDKPTLKDHAWLYFVNGISGDIAADKKTLHTGDSIEWRYMKPTY
jgi:hypothetical protein